MREREQLHEVPRPPVRPRGRRDGVVVHAHLESAQETHVDAPHLVANHPRCFRSAHVDGYADNVSLQLSA